MPNATKAIAVLRLFVIFCASFGCALVLFAWWLA